MSSNSKSYFNKALSGILWQYIGIAIQIISQLIVISVLARVLKPNDFGLIGLALIFTGLSNLITEGGIGAYIIRTKNLNDNTKKAAFLLSMIISCTVIFIIYFISNIIAEYFKNDDLIPILRTLSISHLFTGYYTIIWSQHERDLNFKFLAVVKIITYLISYGLIGILSAINGYGVWSLVFSYVSHSAIRTVILFFNNNIKLGFNFKPREIKNILNFSIGLTYSKIFAYTGANIDKFIIGKTMGTYMLGIYNQSMQIVFLPITYIGMVAQRIIFPIISRYQDDKIQLSKLLSASISINSIIMFPGVVLIFVNTNHIVNIFLGDQWFVAIPIIQVLFLSIIFTTSALLCDAVIKARGLVYLKSLKEFFYALSVAFICYFGSKYGLETIAKGIILSSFFNLVLSLAIVKYSIKISIRKVLAGVSSGLFVGFLFGIIFHLIDLGLGIGDYGPISFLISLIGLMLIYFLLFIFYPNIYNKDIIKVLTRTIPIKYHKKLRL